MKYKISDLRASNLQIISVHPDSPLSEATTKMMVNDFSQLPVISKKNILEGYISWKTIGTQKSIMNKKDIVKEYMDKNAPILKTSDNILDSVNHILEKEFVFIKNDSDETTGIITIYDIAFQFKQLSEPIIYLELIENSLRKIIEKSMKLEEMLKFVNINSRDRIKTIKDLSFGDYNNIIENKEGWEKLNLNLDRKVMRKKLGYVNTIRNNLMHFKTEVKSEDIQILKEVSKFFRVLQKAS